MIDTAAIRARAEKSKREAFDAHCDPVYADVPALCDEIDRLRALVDSATEFETRTTIKRGRRKLNVRVRVRAVDANGEFWEVRKVVLDGDSVEEDWIFSSSLKAWKRVEDEDDTPGMAIIKGEAFGAAEFAFAALAAARKDTGA